MTGRFEDKVALVTGAGSGMGRAISARLVEEGARVFAVDIDAERLEETRGLITGTLEVHQADLGDPARCVDTVRACIDAFGRLDVLGNVAGIYTAGHVTDETVASYRRLMSVNLDAYFFLAQSAIPFLLETGGNIVNIASNAGLQGVPYSVVYCMSKGGVVQLARALAAEFIKTPLRVNAIAPGGTRTNIGATLAFPADADAEILSRFTGFRGLAEPEEIAGVFAFLASDEARSVTGSVYTVDYGLTA